MTVKKFITANVVIFLLFGFTSSKTFPQDKGKKAEEEKEAVKLKWRFSRDKYFLSSPCISQNRVYVGNDDKHVYCLDAKSGKALWSHKTNGMITHSSPAIAKGSVYIGAGQTFLCLDAKTGAKNWIFKTKDYTQTSPVVKKNRVYFGSDDEHLYCLNASSGEEIWKFKTGNVDSSPAVAGNFVFFGNDNGKIICLDAGSGKRQWVYKTDKMIQASPAIAGGILYVGNYGGKFLALNAKTGKKIWAFQTGGEIVTSAAADHKTVYFAADKTLYRLDGYSGKVKWKLDLGSNINTSPVLVNEKIYLGAKNGFLYCLNANSGERMWKYKANSSISGGPSIVKKYIFFCTYSQHRENKEPGKNIVYGLRQKSEKGPGRWPMYRGNPHRTGTGPSFPRSDENTRKIIQKCFSSLRDDEFQRAEKIIRSVRSEKKYLVFVLEKLTAIARKIKKKKFREVANIWDRISMGVSFHYPEPVKPFINWVQKNSSWKKFIQEKKNHLRVKSHRKRKKAEELFQRLGILSWPILQGMETSKNPEIKKRAQRIKKSVKNKWPSLFE